MIKKLLNGDKYYYVVLIEILKYDHHVKIIVSSHKISRHPCESNV